MSKHKYLSGLSELLRVSSCVAVLQACSPQLASNGRMLLSALVYKCSLTCLLISVQLFFLIW